MQYPRILIVDADISLGQSIKENIRGSNYLVTQVASYDEGLETLKTEEYSVVLLEIENPTSQKAFWKIQEIWKYKKIPIIITCAEVEPQFLLQMLRSGVFGFVHKPQNINDTIDCIKSAISTKEFTERVEIISATIHWIEVEIPASALYIVALNSFLKSFMVGVSERECQRILYAFRELVQNAIEHGCRNSLDKKIRVMYFKTPKFVQFMVSDQGEGFNLKSLPHAAIGSRKYAAMEVIRYRKQSGMRPGGLGISSVLGIADELIYNQKGNSVVMVKYIESSNLSEDQKELRNQ